MSKGSTVIECVVALLLTSTVAVAGISSLLTCSMVQRRLHAAEKLSAMTQALDGLQGADSAHSKEILRGALEAIAGRVDAEGLRCSLDELGASMRCESDTGKRTLPVLITNGGLDASK